MPFHRNARMQTLRLAAALLVALLSACSTQTAAPGANGSRVTAAETFLADIAQNVAGTRLTVESLLAPGVDPHEFQPAPQDAIKIAQSRLLIVNGLSYESWLQKSLQEAGATSTILTASQGLTPAADGDPHAWMDPANVLLYVDNIRDGLTQGDPSGKDVYAANAAAYGARLKQLDAAIKADVAQIPPERRVLVTSHDDLGWFARAYGFTIVGAVIPSTTNEASPSAQQMAALIDTVKRTKAPAIFVDVSENPNLAQQVASGTGAKVVSGLYVESLSAPGGPAATYIDMLTYDARLIVDALK